jgi:Na+/melibiose symporter-like transporter
MADNTIHLHQNPLKGKGVIFLFLIPPLVFFLLLMILSVTLTLKRNSHVAQEILENSAVLGGKNQNK